MIKPEHEAIPSYFKRHFKKPGNIALEKYLKENNFFVFSFVRHPFDRLVSAYLDKIAGNPNSYQDERKNIVLKFSDDNGVQFDHFIEYVVSEVKRFLNCQPIGLKLSA